MKPLRFDKSLILLGLIILILAGAVAFAAFSLRSDEVSKAMRANRVMNIAVIIELDGKPVSTQLFMYYPSAGRAAILDVPGETGVILKSLKRTDRIDAVYSPGRPARYIAELAAFLDTAIDGWVILDERGLSAAADLMDGIELFIPTVVMQNSNKPVRLPGGAVVLDGDKVLQYVRYREEGESDSDQAARRQKLFQAFVKRMAAKSAILRRRDVFFVFSQAARSNFTAEARLRLVSSLSRFDADRLVLQRITGNYRAVDGQTLLFPHYDGELVRDIVRQTRSALSNAAQGPVGNKIYTVEILNATPSKGLASRTGELFQSFGYEVVSVGNISLDTAQNKTTIIDHNGDPQALSNIAAVIKCEATSVSPEQNAGVVADFTIILGKDFDGRYVR